MVGVPARQDADLGEHARAVHPLLQLHQRLPQGEDGEDQHHHHPSKGGHHRLGTATHAQPHTHPYGLRRTRRVHARTLRHHNQAHVTTRCAWLSTTSLRTTMNQTAHAHERVQQQRTEAARMRDARRNGESHHSGFPVTNDLIFSTLLDDTYSGRRVSLWRKSASRNNTGQTKPCSHIT